MKIVIIAGGQGSRLKPYTNSIPKCLVKVDNHSILEWQIRAIECFKPEEVIIVTGYKNDLVKKELYNILSNLNIRLVNNEYYDSTNNCYGLLLAVPYMGEKNIIINGDIIFHRDILKELYSNNGNLVATVKKDLDEDDMKVRIENNQITELNKKLYYESGENVVQALGMYRIENVKLLEKELLKLDKNDFFNTAISNMTKKTVLKNVDITNFPAIEIDFPIDLEQANDLFKWGVNEWDIGIRQTTSLNVTNAMNLLIDFKKVMEKANIPWFICFGTALGAYRDKAFFSWDKDIDVGIYLEDRDKYKECEKELKELGCYIPYRYNYYYDRWVIRDKEKIEVHCFEKIDDMRVYDIFRPNFRFPSKMLENLVDIEFYGQKFKIPSDTDNFMELSYGKEWRKPKGSETEKFNTVQIGKSVDNITILVGGRFKEITEKTIELLSTFTKKGLVYVGIQTDEFLLKNKLIPLLNTQDTRQQLIRHLKFITDCNVAGNDSGIFIEILKTVKPNIFIKLDDPLHEWEITFCKNNNINIVNLDYFSKELK